MNKKIFYIILGIIIMGYYNVNASCAYSVNVGDSWLCIVKGSQTTSNKDHTAYWDEDKFELILNNYDGGKITFNDGNGNPIYGYTIRLIGENTITNLEGYGIDAPIEGVKFVGPGTLVINSLEPIVYHLEIPEPYQYKGIYSSVIFKANSTKKIADDEINRINKKTEEEFYKNYPNIKRENEVTDEDVTKEQVKTTASESKKENNLNSIFTIATISEGVLLLFSLITIIILVRKNKKLKIKINQPIILEEIK